MKALLADLVIQACNPSYPEGRNRMIWFQGQFKQKLARPYLKADLKKYWGHGLSGRVLT
jgi:hypothetical protein